MGDTVALNQMLADVETAKAVVELPSPYAGTVTELFADPGTLVEVGSPLIAFDVPDEVGESGPDAGAPDSAAPTSETPTGKAPDKDGDDEDRREHDAGSAAAGPGRTRSRRGPYRCRRDGGRR